MGGKKEKSEAGERETEGLTDMNKEKKKDWQRDRLGQRSGDLCHILQQRQPHWHLQAQQASDDMQQYSQAVTEVAWSGTSMLSRGGETVKIK